MFDWVFFFKCFLDEFVINWLISGDFFLFCFESIYWGIFFEVNFIFSFFVFLFKFKIGYGFVLDIDLLKKKKLFRILNKFL